MPAEMFHPTVFIQEEMDARGWDLDDLAFEMIRDDRDHWGVTRLALDFYFEVGPDMPNMRIGERSAAQLAHAFGVSAEFFLNLERSWREWMEAQTVTAPSPPAGDAQNGE
jgi:hypothetical protein